MADRVPIGTHPGLVLGLVSQDLVVASFGATVEVSELWLRRTDHQATGQVVASLRNATAGGGDGIAVTLGDGVASASGSGSILGTTFYLRVSAADPFSQNLTGWFTVQDAATVTTALTNLARLKRYLGETGTVNDTLMNELIAGQSAAMQAMMRRQIALASVTAEIHDGHGGDRLILERWPATAISEARQDGVAVAASTYELDAARGFAYRRNGTAAGCWDLGWRNWQLDYAAGFAAIPEDLADAATRQVAYMWKSSQPGGGRVGNRGTALDTGSSQFLVGPWAPGVLELLRLYTNRRVA